MHPSTMSAAVEIAAARSPTFGEHVATGSNATGLGITYGPSGRPDIAGTWAFGVHPP
jgi:hypothetical protein